MTGDKAAMVRLHYQEELNGGSVLGEVESVWTRVSQECNLEATRFNQATTKGINQLVGAAKNLVAGVGIGAQKGSKETMGYWYYVFFDKDLYRGSIE
jgi:hypothetical protein